MYKKTSLSVPFLLIILLVWSFTTILFPIPILAAACPITDGGAGDGDATVNGTITINTNTTWSADAVNLGSFNCSGLTIYVTNNATLTLASYTNNDTTYTDDYGVQITAAAITIDAGATISADEKGYAGGLAANGFGPGGGTYTTNTANAGGGGGHGGPGGAGTNGPAGGVAYDLYSAPTMLGSGGGGNSGRGETGKAGGGAMKFSLTGAFTANGTVTANGGTGTWAGSGAGGSIHITTSSLEGNGVIRANGGGLPTGTRGGGGGGGRVIVNYAASSFTGTVTADGGAATATYGTVGSPGTALLIDTVNNDLLIPGSQTWDANPSLEGSVHTYRNITVKDNVTWYLQGHNINSTGSDGIGFTFNVTDFTLPSTSSINMDGRGYAGGDATSLNGKGPGGGAGRTGAYTGGGGGGHGGAGGNSEQGNAGGITNDSLLEPMLLGSGGGHGQSAGEEGGGAVKIAASGTTTINGAITANGIGAYAGAGAGGSIYITSTNFSGSGTIVANGGNGGRGGGGGGGRIAIHYSSTNNFGGSISADGGTSSYGNPGVAGSAFIVDTAKNNLIIPANNGTMWNASEFTDWNFENITLNGNHSVRTQNAELLEINVTNLTLGDNVTWTVGGSHTNDSDGKGVLINVNGNLTIPATSKISGDGMGYSGGNCATHPNGYGPGGGEASCGTNYSAGGGYGGIGGNGYQNVQKGGATYGSKYLPRDLGSGGGAHSTIGYAGGGAIELNISGDLTISGTISANGVSSYPGSGGSILVKANNISGAGSITANGGNGSSVGSGAGGRIAIYHKTSNTFSGTITANGGTKSNAGTAGQAGTIHQAGLANVSSGPGQYLQDGTTAIVTGGETSESSVKFKAGVKDGDSSNTLYSQVEIAPVGFDFTDKANYQSLLTTYSGSAVSSELSTAASHAWYDASWSRRKLVQVSNTSATVYTNYVVLIEVDYDGNMKADFSDIRFTNSSGSLLSHTLSYKTDATKAGFWVKVDSLAASTITNLYMYYGNSVATSASDGASTHQNYYGFSGTTIDTAAFAYGGGTVTQNEIVTLQNNTDVWDNYLTTKTTNARVEGLSFQAKVKVDPGTRSMIGWHDSGVGASYVDLVHAIYFITYFGGKGQFVIYEDGTSRGALPVFFTEGEWYDIRIDLKTTGAKYYYKPSNTTTWVLLYDSVYSSESNLKLGVAHLDAAEKTYTDDWIITREATMDTMVTFGLEQSSAVPGLASGSYHWQFRSCDITQVCGAWQSYGENSENSADFVVETASNLSPDAPSLLGPSSLVNGSFGNDDTPTLNFNITDFDSDNLKYTLQIDDTADFSSPLVDYTSALELEGAREFTVGQAAGSGAYTVGSESQTLSDGNYYWRVKAIDPEANESSFVAANNGAIAFKIDTVVPNTVTNLGSSSHTISTWSNDATIDINWTAATDDNSGIAGYSYLFDTVADSDVDNVAEIGSVTTVTSGTLSSGNSHYFHIKTQDVAGNWSELTTHLGPFFIDTVVPTTPGTPSTTTPTTDTTPTWNWTASTDANSGLQDSPYEVRWCTVSNYSGCAANVETVSTNSFTHSNALTEGTWYFSVRAKDVANNTTAYSGNGSVIIDVTGPTAGSIVINGGEATTTSNNVTLTITATDPRTVTEMMISENSDFSGASWENYSTSRAFALSLPTAVTKTVYVKFRDSLGNESAETSSDSIYLYGAPNNPASLTQYYNDGTTILPTGSSSKNSTVFKFNISDGDANEVLVPQVEYKPLGTSFSNTPSITGNPVTTNITEINADVPSIPISSWYDVNWTNRRVISLVNQSSTTASNYQVKITIPYDGNMQTDFDDLRFVTANNTLLDYWIESKSDSVEAVVWVEVNTLPANTTTNIFMYYGNAASTSVSDANSTFLFFDNFSGAALDTNKWQTDAINGITETVNNYFRFEDATKSAGTYWIYDTTDTGSQHKALWTPTHSFIIDWKETISNTSSSHMGQGGIGIVGEDLLINSFLGFQDGQNGSISSSQLSIIESNSVKSTAVSSNQVRDFRITVNGNQVANYKRDDNSQVYSLVDEGTVTDINYIALTAGAYGGYSFVNHIQIENLMIRGYLDIEPLKYFGNVQTTADVGGEYHWQARACDNEGLCSSWVTYGGNLESDKDFGIVSNSTPVIGSLGPTSLMDGSYTSDTTPAFNFATSDTNSEDTVKFNIQVDDTSDFSSPVLDYTSNLIETGSHIFTVGQAVGSGMYTVGSEGQTLSDGNYYWRVKVIDSDNAESAFFTANSGAIAFRVATNAPGTVTNLTSTTHSLSTWSNLNDVTFNWTAATHSGVGISGYSYVFDTSSTSSVDNTTEIEDMTTLTISDLSTGSYYLHIKAIDNIGLSGGVVDFGPIQIDVTSPDNITGVTSSTHTLSNWTNTKNITLNWTASIDTNSGIEGYSYIVDSVSNTTSVDNIVEIGNVSTLTINNLSDGINYIHLKAIDNVGNTSAIKHIGPYWIDSINPGTVSNISSSTHTIDTWSSANDIAFEWSSATDASSGISGYSYLIDTSPTSVPDNSKDINNVTTLSLSNLTDGEYYFHIKALDNAGNWGNEVHTGPYKIDTTSPTVVSNISSSTHTINTWSNANGVTFNWSASTDSGSGLAGYSYAIDNNSTTAIDNSTELGSVTTLSVSDLANGSYYLHIKSVDTLGNGGETIHFGPILIDANPGTITNLASSTHTLSTWTTVKNLTVTWTVNDIGGSGISGYSYTLNNEATSSVDSTTEIGNVTTLSINNIPDGSYYLHIKAIDNANNESETDHFGPLRIDTTAPTTPGVPTSSNSKTQTPTLGWNSSTDVGSGLAGTNTYTLVWCLNSTFSGCEGNTATTNINSYTFSSPLANGTWHAKVKAKDNLNLESSFSGTASFVVDTTPPTGSIKINSSSSTTNAVNLTLSATDNISNTSNIQMIISESSSFGGASYESFASSKNFTLSAGSGVKTIYAKFKDQAGNESITYTASITITEVILAPPPSTNTNTDTTTPPPDEVPTDTSKPTEPDGETTEPTPTTEPETKIINVVKIKVVDSNNNPLAGAVVKININGEEKEAVTDENGVAQLPDVPEGEHKVVIEHEGKVGEQVVRVLGESVSGEGKNEIIEADVVVLVKEEDNTLNYVIVAVLAIPALIALKALIQTILRRKIST